MRFRIRTVKKRALDSKYPIATFYDSAGKRHLKHLRLEPELMAMPRDVRAVFRNMDNREICKDQPQEVRDWVQAASGFEERQRKPKSKAEAAKKTGEPGRPSRLPRAALELLQAAGYKADGARIHRDMATFFTLETAEIRFRELEPELQAQIASPLAYLEACKEAERALKAASRHGVSSSFEEQLRKILEGLAEAS